MKKAILGVFLLSVVGFTCFLMGARPSQSQWATVRSTVSAAESDINDVEKTWDYYRANLTEGAGYSFYVPDRAIVEVAFTHKNADSDTASFVIYGYKTNGDAAFVCSGACTAGAMASNGGRYYCDTIGTQVERWPGALEFVDEDGDDGMARVVFDACDYRYFVILFTAVSTSDNVQAQATWYQTN